MSPPPVRRLLVALAVALALAGLAAWGVQLALERLRGAVEAALGERGHVGAVRIAFPAVEVLDLRLAGARGWPAPDELRAARIRIVPAFASLWQRGAWRLESITVEGAWVSALRTRAGRLRVLPSLLEGGPAREVPQLAIGTLRLVDAAVEFHDASVRQPPHRLRLEGVQATLEGLELPALAAPVGVDLKGVLDGVRHDGRFSVAGEVTPATRDARLDVRFAAVDLLALQPYLLKAADTGVRRGRLDLTLDARAHANRLHAPGVVTLTDLELAEGGTLAGLPRQAVLAALRRDGRIRIAFTLDGRLDDPGFSLDENLATRVASGLAESLGVSVRGVVEGVGNVVKGLFGR